MNKYIDIQRTFDITSGKTRNLNTHMQIDSIYVDFGLITNAGLNLELIFEDSAKTYLSGI
jgi:hypothetical protein